MIPVGLLGGVADPIAVTFLSSMVSNAATTTYTLAFAAVPSDGMIVVEFGCRNVTPRTISGCTVAGAAATLGGKIDNSGGTSSAVFAKKVTAGTSGNIVVTLSGAPDRAGIGAHFLTNAQSETPTSVQTARDVTNPSVSIDVQAGGAVMGECYVSGASAGTWTGLTENYDDALSGPNGHSGASLVSAAGQTGLVVQRSDTGTSEERLVVCAYR